MKEHSKFGIFLLIWPLLAAWSLFVIITSHQDVDFISKLTTPLGLLLLTFFLYASTTYTLREDAMVIKSMLVFEEVIPYQNIKNGTICTNFTPATAYSAKRIRIEYKSKGVARYHLVFLSPLHLEAFYEKLKPQIPIENRGLDEHTFYYNEKEMEQEMQDGDHPAKII